MTNFAPVFGSYTYDAADGIYVEELTNPVVVTPRFADTPGYPGQYSAGGLLATRKINLRGQIVKVDGTLRDAVEAFNGAHLPGVIQAFYLYPDRYCWAEVTGIGDMKYSGTANFQVGFDVELSASDPFFYGTVTNTTSGLVSGGTVTASGTAPAAPIWTVVVSAIGSSGTITIANTTTAEAMILAPSATGTYLIDSRLQAVTGSGTDVSEQLAGAFLTLAVGSNTITVATDAGAAVSSISVTWANRYI